MPQYIGNVDHYLYPSHDIKLCYVQFDFGFGASELSPIINNHAQIDNGGVKYIEFITFHDCILNHY